MAKEVDSNPLKDYGVPTDKEPYGKIVHRPLEANNFELKPSLIGMVPQNQFLRCLQKTQIYISLFLLIIVAP